MKKLIDRIFKDKDGKWAIWQTPNLAVILWLVFRVIGGLVDQETIRQFSDVAAFGFSFAWAWNEIISGSSYFRRALGLVILAFIIKGQI
jgi:hypothetical protein